jgi:hypothetical protein
VISEVSEHGERLAEVGDVAQRQIHFMPRQRRH